MAAAKKKVIGGRASKPNLGLRILAAGVVYGVSSVLANFLFIDLMIYPLISPLLKDVALPGSFALFPSGPFASVLFILVSGFLYATAYHSINPLMPGRSAFSKGLYFGIFVWIMAVVPFLVLLSSLSWFFVGSVALWIFDLMFRNIIGCSIMAWYLERY